MNNILIIAKNTFKEAIRDKILYGILAFALIFIFATIFLGSLSLGEDLKVIKDLGLAGIYLFSIIITIFISAQAIYKEIEKKTIYIVLAKPVKTFEFIIGKFLGLLTGIVLTILIMQIVYLVVVLGKGGGFDSYSLISLLLQIFEIGIFVSLAVLFSTFSTPFASMLYSIILLYIGHSLSILLKYAEKAGSIAKYAVYPFYYLLPNLEKFNVRNTVVNDKLPGGGEVTFSIIYGIFYIIVILYLANLSLKKQEL